MGTARLLASLYAGNSRPTGGLPAYRTQTQSASVANGQDISLFIP